MSLRNISDSKRENWKMKRRFFCLQDKDDVEIVIINKNIIRFQGGQRNHNSSMYGIRLDLDLHVVEDLSEG